MSSCIYDPVVFGTGTRNTQWGKNNLVNKYCWESLILICKKVKLNLCLTSFTITNSKWIKELHVIPKTLKVFGKS
jgi:hypothetical protein